MSKEVSSREIKRMIKELQDMKNILEEDKKSKNKKYNN